MLAKIIGVAIYGYFFYVFSMTFAWISNVGSYIPAVGQFFPRGLDGDMVPPKNNAIDMNAVIRNVLILGLFAVQHCTMARPATKSIINKIIPFYMERSLFVLLASAILHLLVTHWIPIPIVIYQVGAPWSYVLWGITALGFVQVFLSTYMIDHFDLFGLRQTFMGRSYTHPPLVVSYLYKYVRHPLYLGFLMNFFSTPVMTVGRLLFALTTTAFILVGIQLEERDIAHCLGRTYIDYKKAVPMLIPSMTPYAPPHPSSD